MSAECLQQRQDLDVTDVSASDVEVDVATNLLDGTVRLSMLWTDEIYLSPDDAERVAQALLLTAEVGRRRAQEGGADRRITRLSVGDARWASGPQVLAPHRCQAILDQ